MEARLLRPKTFLLRVALYLYCCVCLNLPTSAFNLDPRIPIIKRGDRGSYFGYTVAEHQQVLTGTLRKNQLLVGAPRANTTQPGTKSPGTVYVCPISSLWNDCQPINLSNFTKNERPPSEENADDGWLGVSLKSRGVGGQVVACAHRYKRNEGEQIWGQGMCHVFTQELSYEDQPYEPCYGQKTTRGHEDFGFCQAGIASELAEDGTLTVGTPGALNWRGGIFSIAVNRQDSVGIDKRWFSSEMNEYRSFVNKVSYLGMAITSGYFLGKGKQMVYIAGAPRENLTGEVILFRKQVDGRNRTLELLARLQGEQVAGQFGYSLASVDLNNDSLPDLVVGCPFFFQNDPVRGGAVYVYLNSEDGVQYAEPKRLLGPADSSFGFAVTNAGDLNLDGYNELAVGAPYDGAGSIFIFQGSASGIVAEPSQIIRAADLPLSGLMTLGYSLSGGIDLDDNGYPDLLSGNFADDTVVLLRARPVINVITEVNDLPRYVSDPHNPPKYCTDSAGKNLTCFSFQPCFRIASQHLKNFDGFQIEYRIEAETFQKGGRVQYSRVKFQNANDPQNPSIITRQVAVTASSWNRALCDESMKQTVLIQDNTRDVLNPIWFKLTYTLLGEEPVLPRQGAPLPRINDYPILDQTNASKIFDVKFYKDCGENDICESDLRVTGALSLPTDSAGNYILSLGENNQIFLNFTLRNEHEAAYQTHLFVQHPATLDYIGSDKKQYACSHLKDIPQLIRCDIGNPFPRNGQVNISMRFNTTKLQPLDREVSVSLWANTTSTQNFSQSALNISANIVVRADIEVRGASDPLELFYSGVVTGASAMKRENDIGLSVNHTYEIRNRGPAKVSSSKVTIRWPLEVENGHKNGKYLLYLLQEPILDGPVICNVDSKYINPAGIELSIKPLGGRSSGSSEEDVEVFRTPALRSSKTGTVQSSTAHPKSLTRVKREKIVAFEERMVENKKVKVVRLDCDRGTAKCIEITCQIRELDRDQPVVIRLRARLWNSTFIEDYRDIDSIEIKSHAEVVVDTTYHVEDAKGNNVAFVLTVAKPDVSIMQPSEELAWWKILLAVLCGLLLLLVLIFILYRCEFFKRKTHMETDPRRQTPSDMGDDHETKRAISPQSDD